MTDAETPKPIEVPKSSKWDIAWSGLRATIYLIAGGLVVMVYEQEGAGAAIGAAAALLPLIPAAITFAFGAVKWIRVNRERRVMAHALPNEIAQVKP